MKKFYVNLFAFFLASILLFLHSVVVAQVPIANFTSDTTSGCAPVQIKFTDVSTNNPTSWRWEVNNNVYTVQNPEVLFETPGIYTVKLSATNAAGSYSIVRTDYIKINAPPVVDFSTADVLGCSPVKARFTDLSTPGSGSIAQWDWNFSDGTTSNTRQPEHTYSTPGTYSVFLKVTNTDGCAATRSKLKYITVGKAVKAVFNSKGNVFCSLPAAVNFDNSSMEYSNMTYLWDFGDGSTSSGISPQHAFNSYGTFKVKLLATSSGGCIDSLEKQITIEKGIAQFSGPASVCMGTQVAFTSSSSPLPQTYEWNMGDGTLYTSKDVNHTYKTAGSFIVATRDTL